MAMRSLRYVGAQHVGQTGADGKIGRQSVCERDNRTLNSTQRMHVLVLTGIEGQSGIADRVEGCVFVGEANNPLPPIQRGAGDVLMGPAMLAPPPGWCACTGVQSADVAKPARTDAMVICQCCASDSLRAL